MRYSCLLVLLIFAMQGMAAFEISGMNVFNSGNPARSWAGTNSNSGFINNPAGITNGRFWSGISYFKPYNLNSLYQASLVVRMPGWKNLNGGVALNSFGNPLYRETMMCLNVSRSFFRNTFYFGVNLRNYFLTIQNYGGFYSWGIDVGAGYFLYDPLFISFSVINLNQPVLNGYRHQIPTLASLGIAFRPGDRVEFTAAVQKEEAFPVNVLVGFSFWIDRNFMVQSGFQSYPGTPSVGLILGKGNVRFHYALQYHFQLGETHFWGISFGGGNFGH